MPLDVVEGATGAATPAAPVEREERATPPPGLRRSPQSMTFPPSARVAALDEQATLDGVRVPLATHEWADGTVAPDGYVHLQSFRLDGQRPVWSYAIAGALLEKQVWMEQGANATWISYHLARGDRPLE